MGLIKNYYFEEINQMEEEEFYNEFEETPSEEEIDEMLNDEFDRLADLEQNSEMPAWMASKFYNERI